MLDEDSAWLDLDLSGFNEADLREEFVSPLLRHLGYRTGTSNNIIREQSLRYPRSFLGRKDPKKDPILRGFADYICCVKDRIQWVVEAKAPTSAIDTDAIEQAYSYARHPEVRGVYFCLTNGHETHVYQTAEHPECGPVLKISLEELRSDLSPIESLLRPDAIELQFPEAQPDFGPPLAPGLRSVARAVSGFFSYQAVPGPAGPLIEGFTVSITGGGIERVDGGLLAYIETRSPYEWMQRVNNYLGFDKMEFRSLEATISTDPSRPTEFREARTVAIPRGVVLGPPVIGQSLPFDLHGSQETIGSGFIDEDVFRGVFRSTLDLDHASLRSFVVQGTFELQLH